MTAPTNTAVRQIARAAGTVMAAFVLSQAIGLARSILVAQAFGTSPPMEAFTAANRVPDMLFNLVAGGALGSAFIPTFTGLITKNERRDAWLLASSIANLIVIILALVGTLVAIFAPQVVRYFLVPGFSDDPALLDLTVDLLRLMLPSAVIFGLSGLVMGILNSHQVFLFPALAPSMYSLGMIGGVLILSPRLGIYGLAWGVLVGASLHLLLQAPSLIRLRPRYFPILGLNLPAVREVARLMGPRLLGVAVVQLNFWLNVLLASQMEPGSVNGVTYAFTLMLMPQAVIAQSIAIAAMPTFAAQVARERLDEMRSALASTLRGVLLLSVPAAVGLVLLREPLVALVYQRGEFDAHSTELVAWALLWYGVGLVGHAVVEIVARAFYAMHDTKTPVFIGAAAMSLNLIFSLLFSAAFARIGWLPHGGLALANSLSTALEMVGLLVLMRRRLNGLEGARLLRGLLQAALASLAMGLGLWAWLGLVAGQAAWVQALGGVAVGGAIFAAAVLLLGVSEVRLVLGTVMQRLGRGKDLSQRR